jgi:hypothetical protein
MKYIYFCITWILLIAFPISYSFAGSIDDYAVSNIKIASPSTLLPGGPVKNLVLVSTDTSGKFIGGIIAWLIRITAVLTVLTITWAGVQMIFATGEEEKFKKARYTMIYAFIGLLVAGLAYGIVTFITNLNLNNTFF